MDSNHTATHVDDFAAENELVCRPQASKDCVLEGVLPRSPVVLLTCSCAVQVVKCSPNA